MTRQTIGLYSFLEKICVLRADKVIAVNENISKYLVEIGCPSHKILRISVFLDTYFGDLDLAGIEKARRTLNINDRHLVFAYIGRISREKNLEILIEAFLDLAMSMRKNLKLLIVGEGEQLNELKSLVNLSDGVLFLGHRNDIGQILSLSDVFVLPSLTEGFPLSLLEAMSFGKAIIASNIPAIREILKDEKEAILFDPRSSEQLKKAMLRFYDDSSLRKKFGENAKKKASKYNIDDVYPRILQVYRESLKKKRFR
jgi:glycosyltransferase involved in cell wall biosynthesis